jgi:hypothetical protein
MEVKGGRQDDQRRQLREDGVMNKVLHGVVHGKTIELSELSGVDDGQEVEVVVKFSMPARPWGEGIRASAGGWADYPEMDAVMEQIQQDRMSPT